MGWNKNLFIGSGVLAALGATICCWGPVMLSGIAGLTGTVYLFSWLPPLKPYLAGIAVISLSYAFYQVYHKKNTEKAGCQYCVMERKKKNRRTKTVLWAVTIFATLSFSYPYYSSALLANNNSETSGPKAKQTMIQPLDTTKHKKEVQLSVTGMSCTGCANRCQKVLFNFKGITHAEVSYKKEMAAIRYNPDHTSVDKIIHRIEEMGFKAKK